MNEARASRFAARPLALCCIVLTGDISTKTSRDVALEHCTQLNKPAKLKEITYVIQHLLAQSEQASIEDRLSREITPGTTNEDSGSPIIFVADNDYMLRETIRLVLDADGREVEDFSSCEAFLEAYSLGRESCLLVDANLLGMKGPGPIKNAERSG